jgi:hypothetical protein
MKKLLVALVFCVLLASFSFAADPDSTVEVTLNVAEYAELTPDGTTTIDWFWNNPNPGGYYLDDETVTFTYFTNCLANITVDNNFLTLGTVQINHDFTAVEHTQGTGSFDVVFSNDFDTTNWWDEDPITDGSAVFVFTIATGSL